MALDTKKLLEEIGKLCEDINQTSQTLALQHNLYNTYKQVYDENPEIQDGDDTTTFQNKMDSIGSHIGVNNPGSEGDMFAKQASDERTRAIRDTGDERLFVEDFITKMVDAGLQLRNYVNVKGKVDTNLLYAHNIDQYNVGGGMSKPVENADYLMKMKDIIDLLSLSFLYYPYEKKTYNQETGEMETTVDKEGYLNSTPKTYRKLAEQALEKMVGSSDPKDIENYILNYLLSDSTIKKYMLDGTLWHNKKGTGYYDRYGEADKNKFYDEHKEEIIPRYLHKIANKMFNAVYGVDLQVPNTLFTYGNNKLHEDTVVINFTSAHRCPAWNECLVSNACYARASEHGYGDLFRKNKNVNMMWEGSKYDSRIMDALKAVIRSYFINFQKIGPVYDAQFANQSSEYGMVGEATKKGVTLKQKQSWFYGIIQSHEGFNSLSEEQLAIIKDEQYGILRAHYIRLNEEGDFIGQWLVDAVDEFAGELKKIGVSTAAYTCRNLNYNGVKNIIINASRAAIGSNVNGDVANAVARRFYAVTEEFYNSLDETYAASPEQVQYDANGNPVNKPVPPTKVGEHIIPYPQPVYNDESGELRNGNYYYYKCPCGRGKKETNSMNPLQKKFNTFVDTNKGSNGVAGKSGINCYDCRVCYEPKNEISDKPIVVYVQVHSTEKELFNYTKQKDTGYSKNYTQNKQELGLNEEIFNVRDEEEDRQEMAIQQITQNAISSVNNHLESLGQQMQMQEENIKKGFKLMLERINGAEF